ncbi:hypothetical protein ACFFX0_02990 [Citricoccus parietis]|uniref:Uncharacterized protein n=1 Tax=Citricoccus parietis TaxID=592307 RepID=A0ABV5FU94_9MICC
MQTSSPRCYSFWGETEVGRQRTVPGRRRLRPGTRRHGIRPIAGRRSVHWHRPARRRSRAAGERRRRPGSG